jgi:hypothetical protein
MSRRSALLCVVIALCVTASVESAVAPSTVNYQAVLTTAGAPVTTPVTVTFTIYDADAGGTVLWTETRSVTPDQLGRVSVRLGEQTALSSDVFGGPNRWLGVQVGGDLEMSPRMPVSSSSYALRTATIDGATGGNMEGDLVLHESATKDFAASSAQILLISLNGDTTIIDPIKLRMVDNLGVEQVSITTDPVTGPVLGISDPGGNVAGHTAAASSYYKNSSLLKSPDALKKTLEVTADGVLMFDEATGDTVGHLRQTTEGPILIMTHNPVVKDATQVSGSVQLGPPDTVFRLRDGAGNTLMQGLQTPTGGTMQFFTKSIPLKAASYKTAEFSEQGMVLFDAVGSPIVRADAQTGYLSGYRATFGRNNNITIVATKAADGTMMNPDPGLIAGDNNTLSGTNSSAIGDTNVVSGPSSLAIGYNNSIAGGRSTTIGSRNFLGYDANDCFLAGDANYAELIGSNLEQVICLGWADTVTGNSANFSALGARHHAFDAAGSAVIGGDSSTFIGNFFSLIGGGFGNTMDGGSIGGGHNAIIGGVYDSVYQTNKCAIIAGEDNVIAFGERSTIGGGLANTIDGSSTPEGFVQNVVLAGGLHNAITAGNASIGGGFGNKVTGGSSVIAGGQHDTIYSENSAVGGGYNNVIRAGANDATISGGADNRITNHYAAIGGGWSNNASGYLSTIPGGLANAAAGQYSFAAGRRAKANHDGTFVWADHTDSDFASSAADQFLIRAAGNVGINTNAPTSMLHVEGAIATKVVAISADHTMGNEAIVMASPTITGLTVSLPDPSTCEGRQITVKKINGGGGSVTVSAGTGAIDGVPTYVLAVQYDFVCVVSDGNDWFIVAR